MNTGHMHAGAEGARQGKFFYAVILPEGEVAPDLLGLNDGRVYTIPHQDIAAVVSDYPITTIKPLRKNLAPYHRVTRTLAEGCTTIPARFGQVARDGEEVQEILQHHYPRVRQELDRLHHKVEMGVQVFWQVENLFAYLIQQDRGLKALRDRLLQKAIPITRQAQIELGSRLRDKLQEIRVQTSQRIMSSLREVAVEAKIDTPTQDEIAMSGLFLVWQDKQEAFTRQIERVAQFMGEEYLLKVDGPWVPFNFIEHIELSI